MDHAEPPTYEICLKESLDADRLGWFEGMQWTLQPDGSTLLSGPIRDQAALQGMLNKISTLGLTLISVNRVSRGLRDGAPHEVSSTPKDHEVK